MSLDDTALGNEGNESSAGSWCALSANRRHHLPLCRQEPQAGPLAHTVVRIPEYLDGVHNQLPVGLVAARRSNTHNRRYLGHLAR